MSGGAERPPKVFREELQIDAGVFPNKGRGWNRNPAIAGFSGPASFRIFTGDAPFFDVCEFRFNGISIARPGSSHAGDAGSDSVRGTEPRDYIHREFERPYLGVDFDRIRGTEAGIGAFILGSTAAILVGAAAGLVMGIVIAYNGAHPILVSLAMMIFLRGVGEFLTRGGDISVSPTI